MSASRFLIGVAVVCCVFSAAQAQQLSLTLVPSTDTVELNQPFTVDVYADSQKAISSVYFDVLFDDGRLSAAVPVTLVSQLSLFTETGTLSPGKISFVGGNSMDGYGGNGLVKLATIDFAALTTPGLTNISLGWTDEDDTAFYGELGLDQGDISFGSTSVNVVPEPASLALLALGGIGLLRRRR
jgi:hypothetical protein